VNENGTFASGRDTYIQNTGTVTGTGAVNAGTSSSIYPLRVQSGATIDPGSTSGPGILATKDLLFENTNSNFDVQLNGLTAGTQYDQLQVDGTATLNGNLNVTLQASFASVGTTFTILDNVSTNPTTGSFNGLPEGGLVDYGGNYWSISYEGGDGNDVVLTTETVNSFPTGDALNVSTNEETAVNITLTGGDTDGVVAGFSIETGPLHGTLSGTAPNVTYTPALNYAGPDSFEFRVTDDDGGFSTAIVSITVDNTPDAPTQINLSNSSVNENIPVGTSIGTLTTVDLDVGDTFAYTLVAGSGDLDNGLFTVVGDQLSMGVIPDYESQSSFSIRVRTTDSDNLTHDQTFVISVNDLPDLPINGVNQVSIDSPVNENAFASLSGIIDDADTGDIFTLAVAWGDGSSNSIALGTTAFSNANAQGDYVTCNPATYEFSVQHQYLDDGESPGNASESDTYTITGTITDGAGASVPLTTSFSEFVLDPTFDVDGRVVTEVGVGSSSHDYGYSVAVTQPDGKVLVGGQSNGWNTNVATVVRHNSNGSLDSSFGEDGVVTLGVSTVGSAVWQGQSVHFGQSAQVFAEYQSRRVQDQTRVPVFQWEVQGGCLGFRHRQLFRNRTGHWQADVQAHRSASKGEDRRATSRRCRGKGRQGDFVRSQERCQSIQRDYRRCVGLL
jgi:hypothetical protein